MSSLSDRSDTSEQGGGGEVSGEESPGILSDDQPPESPSESNETDDTSSHLPWLKVIYNSLLMCVLQDIHCCLANKTSPFFIRQRTFSLFDRQKFIFQMSLPLQLVLGEMFD